MKKSVWYRSDESSEWCLASPMWQSIEESRAHMISDRMNECYDYGMWWVSKDKPSNDKIVAEKV